MSTFLDVFVLFFVIKGINMSTFGCVMDFVMLLIIPPEI